MAVFVTMSKIPHLHGAQVHFLNFFGKENKLQKRNPVAAQIMKSRWQISGIDKSGSASSRMGAFAGGAFFVVARRRLLAVSMVGAYKLSAFIKFFIIRACTIAHSLFLAACRTSGAASICWGLRFPILAPFLILR